MTFWKFESLGVESLREKSKPKHLLVFTLYSHTLELSNSSLQIPHHHMTEACASNGNQAVGGDGQAGQ